MKCSVALIAIVLFTGFYPVFADTGVSVGQVGVLVEPKEKPKPSVNIAQGEVRVVAVHKANRTETIEEYRKALNISGVVVGRVGVVAELMERKEENKESFERITSISRSAEKDEDKEIIAEELLKMDDKFVEKFNKTLEKEPEAKGQIEEYAQTVKAGRKFEIRNIEDKIRDLFSKKITVENLIEQIWNGF